MPVEKDVYEQMTDKIMMTGSKLIPELFRMIANGDEADLLLAMPGTPAALSQKTGADAETVGAMCRTLYQKGLAFKSFRGETVAYKMCRDMIQFHDATILWPDATQAYFDLWQRFMEEEWPVFAKLAEQVFPKPFTRIIPVGRSIETGKQQILDAESVTKIIEDAEVIAVTKCTCRVIAHKCDLPVEVCLQVNNAARYTLDRGTGRELTREEALEILHQTEEAGLVHVTMNKAHVSHFICNCCPCCCQALPLVISDGLKICDPSRYQAVIDVDLCVQCGTCVERCYFNAIREDGSAMVVDETKCMGCGLCHGTCPEKAIRLIAVREIDFIPA